MILKENLIKLVAKTTLNLTDEQITLLDNYVMMLDKWNKAYNLTSVRDPKEMLVKHIMDSIMVSPHLQGNTFIDVGTGPGLPGVPLAIINPNKQFDLVDSLGKRIRFLKQVQFELKLDNINPVQSRIEQYTNKHFDGVISRAFALLNDMLSWCQHLPKQNGAFYALKGNISQQEIDNIPNGFKVKETIELHIPNLDAQRHLVILQKS